MAWVRASGRPISYFGMFGTLRERAVPWPAQGLENIPVPGRLGPENNSIVITPCARFVFPICFLFLGPTPLIDAFVFVDLRRWYWLSLKPSSLDNSGAAR